MKINCTDGSVYLAQLSGPVCNSIRKRVVHWTVMFLTGWIASLSAPRLLAAELVDRTARSSSKSNCAQSLSLQSSSGTDGREFRQRTLQWNDQIVGFGVQHKQHNDFGRLGTLRWFVRTRFVLDQQANAGKERRSGSSWTIIPHVKQPYFTAVIFSSFSWSTHCQSFEFSLCNLFCLNKRSFFIFDKFSHANCLFFA